MKILCNKILEDRELAQLPARIEAGGMPVALSGLEGVHRAHVAAALHVATGRPLFVLCADELDAERTARDLESLTGEPVYTLFSREFALYNAESVSHEGEQKRLQVLRALQQGRAPVVVATPDALLQRTLPPETLAEAEICLRLGGEYDLEELTRTLVRIGYSRCEQVEGGGQFALRGGILDVFSPAFSQPFRCEFFGDEVDSMGFFDVDSQRRTETVEQVSILPAAECAPGLYIGGKEGFTEELEEFLSKIVRKKSTKPELVKTIGADIERLKTERSLPAADRYLAMIFPEAAAADYIPQDAIIALCDSPRITERAKNWSWQLSQDMESWMEAGLLAGELAELALSWDLLREKLAEFPALMLDSFVTGDYPLKPRELMSLLAKRLPAYGGSLETAAEDIAGYVKNGYATVLLCSGARKANILKEILAQKGVDAALDFELKEIPKPGQCSIALGGLSAGVEYPALRLAVIAEEQFGAPGGMKKVRKKPKNDKNRQKLERYTDLNPGDLVVHEYYGIGRFIGIVQMPVDGADKDYIKIAYQGSDSLYVPATQLDLVSKYIGAGDDAPVKLSKMGGGDWQKAKSRAKKAAKDLAQGLITLYSQRQKTKGHAFAPDSVWQTEFEEAFEYAETEDQLLSVQEIKKDMESERPMDRVLCGDVGYGKTEVALRAVMKCVLDGKQAAILVPTTVLAQQHYQTALRRFSGYPIRIEVLSRFRSQAQMKEALKNIKGGAADIVIGTHRLLQKDIEFKDLGLLIVDEEQRFGVAHKERLKEMTKAVDVLTLSATPIPRTLNMALSGLRDMSTLEEPPTDRHPVQTYVLEHDWAVLADAIRREVSRGGQVYYLHNRVESIERTASRLSAMLEGIVVDLAHGKMDEQTLSAAMERMRSGETQVLVCTTIIETGIDISNVNTLIIEDADKLGLAQLHQIRGRVGRSARRASAYLTFRRGKVLTDIAQKRLSAIREFAEFNSGFKIAMRDLEIRGAGNLLGAEQSGHMCDVGYDMYLKLLEEAVAEEKGEKTEKKAECSADLAVSANIPEVYVPSGEMRMDLYRRIAQIRTDEDADDMMDELIDRFGDPPQSVELLLKVALLRARAATAGITEITQRGGLLRFALGEFDMERISRVYALPDFKNRVRVEAGTKPMVSLKLRQGKAVISEADAFVAAFAAAEDKEAV